MAYVALYRKYRPTDFNGVIGQDKVIKVIQNAVLNNKVSHAYIFSGPRGTGKTTTAKIIAKILNCQSNDEIKPCGKCENCLHVNNNDIIEIDAASNNGIDEIREIKEKVNLVPSNSKYKIYIIDEVHMLTTQAFNALLKTLEEPPHHVIFILATTEIHKIPLTILSRCQKFQFNKIDESDLVKILTDILLKENKTINEEILYEIARISDGGCRDAINLLDQLLTYKDSDYTLEDLYLITGSVSKQNIFNLVNYIKNNKRKEIIDIVEKLDNEGKSLTKFINDIIYFLKDVLIYQSIGKTTNEYVEKCSNILSENDIFLIINELSKTINNIKFSDFALIQLIVSLLKISSDINVKCKNKINDIQNDKVENDKLENKSEKNIIEEKDDIKPFDENISKTQINLRINNTFALADKKELNIIKEKWKKINDYLFDDNYSLVAGLLKDAIPMVASNKNIILVSKYNSIVDRINNSLKKCEDLLFLILKNKFKIICLDEETWQIEKEKYIDNLKKKIKYEYKDETTEKLNNLDDNKTSYVDKLIDIVGNENIVFK